MSHSTGHFGDIPQANLMAWYGKLNLTQLRHTFTNQKKCTTTQNKHKKTKARFSRLIRHPAWKRRGPILVLALHQFVTYLDTYSLTYSPRTHMGPKMQQHAGGKLQIFPIHVYLASQLRATPLEFFKKHSV